MKTTVLSLNMKEDMKLIMKITGTRGYVKFDLEYGYVMKAEGGVLIDRTFIVQLRSPDSL